MQEEIFSTENLDVMEGSVDNLILQQNPSKSIKLIIKINYHWKLFFVVNQKECLGIILENGMEILCQSVVLTTGTFLRGTINYGIECKPAGRIGDQPAMGLAETLEQLNFSMGRLKTGNYIDYAFTYFHVLSQ